MNGPERRGGWIDVAPPTIASRPTSRALHGEELVDNYAWLRAENWREILRDPDRLAGEIREVIEAENDHAARHLDPLADLVDALKAEMRARIKEDDATVPMADGD